MTRRESRRLDEEHDLREAVDELSTNERMREGSDRSGGELLLVLDARERAIDLGDELVTESGPLVLVPGRGLLELGDRDGLDPEALHGLRARTASTAARARATASSRDTPGSDRVSASPARRTTSAICAGSSCGRGTYSATLTAWEWRATNSGATTIVLCSSVERSYKLVD